MANQKSKSSIKSTAIAIFFIVIVLMYFKHLVDTSNDRKVKNNSTEIDKLCEYDMVKDYPKTPRDVVKLHCRFFKAFYIGDVDAKTRKNYVLDDDKLAVLNHQIRSLYSSELLSINLESDSLVNLKNSINNMKKEGYSYKNYVIPEHSQVKYYTQNGVEMATLEVELVMGTTEERGYVYVQYVLVKEDGLWKILGWGDPAK